nr:hypothetical protein [Tanacetum cinerariifolium]
MTSFGHRLNPRFAIKECLSCGALYTGDFCCSKGNVEDKILVPKPPKNYARCAKCGHPEDLVSCLKYFHDASESFGDSTNIVNAPREPFVVKQDHGIKSSQNPPPIDECCCECGDPLDGIFCKQCTCKSCGRGSHIGYNCPPKVPIIPNPEPCNNQTIDELPQALPIFHPTFHSEAESPFTLDSTPTYVDESLNVFNPPPQPPVYPCGFCGNDAYFGHYCTPQAQFNNPEQGYTKRAGSPRSIFGAVAREACSHLLNSLNDSPSIFETSSQSPPNIDHCCYECGDPLDGIFCKQCTCKSCGKCAHIGYNYPSKVPIIPNPKPCNNQTIDEIPQALPIFHPTFHSEAESPFTLDSTPTYVDKSPNVFNPPPQPPVYLCEFCGNDARYGHYCTPQAQFNNPGQGYSQDFNFPQNIHNFQQHYFCCDQCGGPHKTFQCQQVNFYEPCCEDCGGPHENF